MQIVCQRLPRTLFSNSAREKGIHTGIASLAGLALVWWSVHSHWKANNRADSDFAERYAEVQLDLLPKDAVLFVFGDATGPIGYYKYVEKRRPDVALYNLQGLVYGERLFSPFLSTKKRDEVLERFIDSNERAIFIPLDVDTYPRRELRIYGLLMEAARGGKPGTIKLKRHPRGEEFFVQLVNQRPTDRWERVRRNEMLFHYGRYLGLAFFTGDPIFQQMQEPFRLAHESYASLIGMATVVLDNGNAAHWPQVAEWLTLAENLRHEALKKKTLAELYFHKGRLLQNQGRTNAAVASFRKSRDIYPHPRNKALKALDRFKIDFKRIVPAGPKAPNPRVPSPR